MQIIRSTRYLHPILKKCSDTIQLQIDNYNMPFRIFETGRTQERHDFLIKKGKTVDYITKHRFNLESTPPLYSTAIDYVYFDKKWSWNLRDSTILAWYILFGNIVLDLCPELKWYGVNRKNINYCHFELRSEIIQSNLKKYPCVIY